jgi:hypothetical protein
MYSLPGPRIVPIRCGASTLAPMNGPAALSRSDSGRCTSSARPPVNLHVCTESRVEALRSYRPLFGLCGNPGRIYVNPAIDTLYFGARDGYMASQAQMQTFLTLASPLDLALVRQVAVNDTLFWPDDDGRGTARENAGGVMVAASLTVEAIQLVRRRLPGVREVVFVPRDVNPLYAVDDNDTTLVEPSTAQTQIHRQVQVAMQTVCAQHPCWTPPSWSIKALSVQPPKPVIYQRSVMGHYDQWQNEDPASCSYQTQQPPLPAALSIDLCMLKYNESALRVFREFEKLQQRQRREQQRPSHRREEGKHRDDSAMPSESVGGGNSPHDSMSLRKSPKSGQQDYMRKRLRQVCATAR